MWNPEDSASPFDTVPAAAAASNGGGDGNRNQQGQVPRLAPPPPVTRPAVFSAPEDNAAKAAAAAQPNAPSSNESHLNDDTARENAYQRTSEALGNLGNIDLVAVLFMINMSFP